jgi:hypothetical protein
VHGVNAFIGLLEPIVAFTGIDVLICGKPVLKAFQLSRVQHGIGVTLLREQSITNIVTVRTDGINGLLSNVRIHLEESIESR